VFDVVCGPVNYSLSRTRKRPDARIRDSQHSQLPFPSSGPSQEPAAVGAHDDDSGFASDANEYFDNPFLYAMDPFSQTDLNNATFGDDDFHFFF
jgi:hypothetical protein